MSIEVQVAESAMKLTIDGVEYTLRLLGKGAAQLIVGLAALSKKNPKSFGKSSVAALIKKQEPIRLFKLNDAYLAPFKRYAKRYGVLFAPIKDPNTNLIDVMVPESQVMQINALLHRIGYAIPEELEFEKEPKQANASQEREGERDEKKKTGSRSTTQSQTQREESNKASVSQIIDDDPPISIPLDELRSILNEPEKAFDSDDKFRFVVESTAKMHQYSEKNMKIIMEERPEAAMIASRSRWEDMGRMVKEDAQPIEIYGAPERGEDGMPVYPKVPVYDIADTEGADLQAADSLLDNETQMIQVLGSMKESTGVPVRISENAPVDGFYDPKDRTIYVPKGATNQQYFTALSVEGAHARLHALQGDTYNRRDAMFSAVSQGYMMASHYNMPVDSLPPLNVKEYAQGKTPEQLRGILQNIKENGKSMIKEANAIFGYERYSAGHSHRGPRNIHMEISRAKARATAHNSKNMGARTAVQLPKGVQNNGR